MPAITQMFIGIIAVMSIVGVIQLQRLYVLLEEMLITMLSKGIEIEKIKR